MRSHRAPIALKKAEHHRLPVIIAGTLIGAGVGVDSCWLKRYLPQSERVAHNSQYETYLNPIREQHADSIVSGNRGAQTFTFHSEPQSFRVANGLCRRAGGVLASIHTAAENRALVTLITGETATAPLNCPPNQACGVWIGLNDNRAEAGTDGFG